jgi:predicted outer membrane repeat protein
MKQLIRILAVLAITASMLALGPLHTARAATHTVTNTNEDGPGSLRDAIANASNGDIIDATGISGTITLTYTIFVGKDVTINGPGRSNLAISGNDSVGVFYIDFGKTVTIRDVTISDGKLVDADGAGIRNFGTLTLENVTVTNNHVVKNTIDFLRGGGIYNHDNASLTVKDSAIIGNSAVQNGGGIHVSFDGYLSLTNVLIDFNSLSYYGSIGGGISIREGTTAILDKVSITNNSSRDGGGGLYSDASLTMTNSLVAGNTVGTEASRGGGIYFAGTGKTFNLNNVTISSNSVEHDTNNADGGGLGIDGGILNLNNVTITNNTADGNGGGMIVGDSATVNFRNTILAGNTSTDNASEDCYGTLNSQGYNLIQDPTGCTIDGSIIGVLISLNPMLMALADNGGPTMTHALGVNSPAVDAGDNATCESRDQRGFPRPQGVTCDMGGYELRKGQTVYRSAGAQDGWILESTETSNAGGTMNATATTFNLGDGTADKQYRSILSFNTASLPDTAVITKVTLKIRVYGTLVGNNNPFTWGQGLKVDVCKGTFGTSALQLTDFNFNNATNCKLLAGTFGSTPTSGWYSVILTSAGRAKINPLGLTQFRLRFYKDDNDDGAADYWRFYSGNYTTVSARPTLIVEYYVP